PFARVRSWLCLFVQFRPRRRTPRPHRRRRAQAHRRRFRPRAPRHRRRLRSTRRQLLPRRNSLTFFSKISRRVPLVPPSWAAAYRTSRSIRAILLLFTLPFVTAEFSNRTQQHFRSLQYWPTNR